MINQFFINYNLLHYLLQKVHRWYVSTLFTTKKYNNGGAYLDHTLKWYRDYNSRDILHEWIIRVGSNKFINGVITIGT